MALTKSENRELANIERYLAAGMKDTAAAALSALIRASRKGRADLMIFAHAWKLTNEPRFIVTTGQHALDLN